MLHVLTGSAKGRRLKVPKGRSVRPTTGKVKKAIFDTLGDISGSEVLDLFAGSGGLGIEALSRGAARVTFVEKDPDVFKVLKENLSLCGFLDRADLIRTHYKGALDNLEKGGGKFDLILIDPPYALYEDKEVGDFVHEVSGVIKDDGIVVIEHNYRLEDSLNDFKRTAKSFGGNHISFFVRGN